MSVIDPASDPRVEGVLDIDDLIASLQDLDDEELRLKGLSVEGTLDEVDDPILLGPDGTPAEECFLDDQQHHAGGHLAPGLSVHGAHEPP